MQLVVAQPAHIHSGAADPPPDRKLLPEQWRWVVSEHRALRERFGALASDPRRTPIRWRKQAHLPPRGCAIGGGAVPTVPRADGPIDPLARAYRRAAVNHLHRLAGGDHIGRAAGRERG